MNLRRVTQIVLWSRRRHAWPLLLLTVPMYYFLLWALYPARTGQIGRNWHVPEFCIFLSQAPVVWALAAIWFVMDAFLIVWMERALNDGGEPARPAKLFFLWQCVKLIFFFLFLSVLIAHGPLNPDFGPPTFE